MSKQPAIVAELGRPETPEETADRKAASRAKHYQNQTVRNLLLALAASMLLMLFIVLIVPRSEVAQTPQIDVELSAANASTGLGTDAALVTVPSTWRANVAELRRGNDGVAIWYVAWITADSRFISLTQAVDANPTWLTQAIGDAAQTGETTIETTPWSVYDRRGSADVGLAEYQLVHEFSDSTVILSGTASDTEFAMLASQITQTLEP